VAHTRAIARAAAIPHANACRRRAQKKSPTHRFLFFIFFFLEKVHITTSIFTKVHFSSLNSKTGQNTSLDF
jgi:hypothetical protein